MLTQPNKIALSALLLALLEPQLGLADQFHYNNIIMGDRAMGLGGAFAGAADDASGLIYNPAGIAFAQSNEISASGNAFYERKVTYKEAIVGDDYIEDSKGSVSPFLGGLVKMDSVMPGVTLAWGVFNRDAELKTQDDLIENKGNIQRFHRAVNVRAQTGGFGIAAAKRLASSLSAGLSLSYILLDELTQDYQDAQQVVTDSSGTAVVQLLTQNDRRRLEGAAMEIGLGLQYSVLPDLSLGLSVKIPQMMSQSFENGFEQTVLQSADSFATISSAMTRQVGNKGASEISNPIGSLPSEYRLGLAWFASTGLLITADVINYSAIKGDLSIYERVAITNYAAGLEWYITPNVPMRFGVFTNNDARPKIDESKTDQQDNIDYMGYSMFFVWAQPNSQISLGGIYQAGKGKAQKIGNTTTTQDVEASSTTLAFSASTNI